LKKYWISALKISLYYQLVNKTIVIRLKPTPAAAPAASEPGRTIKAFGIVYNESGQPLAGANVIIKVTERGRLRMRRASSNCQGDPGERNTGGELYRVCGTGSEGDRGGVQSRCISGCQERARQGRCAGVSVQQRSGWAREILRP